MNIIIAMPSESAQQIYDGEKTIEVRTVLPSDFDYIEDAVFVCETETGNVTGFFTIDEVVATNKPSSSWVKEIHRALLHKADCKNIEQRTKKVCFWHIDMTARLPQPYSLSSYFGIQETPETFVYTTIDWTVLPDGSPMLVAPRQKAVQ